MRVASKEVLEKSLEGLGQISLGELKRRMRASLLLNPERFTSSGFLLKLYHDFSDETLLSSTNILVWEGILEVLKILLLEPNGFLDVERNYQPQDVFTQIDERLHPRRSQYSEELKLMKYAQALREAHVGDDLEAEAFFRLTQLFEALIFVLWPELIGFVGADQASQAELFEYINSSGRKRLLF